MSCMGSQKNRQGKEEGEGGNCPFAHGIRLARGGPAREYSQSYDRTKNVGQKIGAPRWQFLKEITLNLLAAKD